MRVGLRAVLVAIVLCGCQAKPVPPKASHVCVETPANLVECHEV